MTDLIIIGSGPGGYETAAYAARHGLQVTIVEERMAGGTCLNHGCIPTKALVHDAAKAATSSDRTQLFHEAMERKERVVAGLRAGVEATLQQPGITLVQGHAAFKDDHTVTVAGSDHSARHIIIATGAVAKMPAIPGMGTDGHGRGTAVVTSEQLLARTDLPRSLCIIGAGVVGMEMASVFSAFGSEVTVVEYEKECLPNMDGDIARRLRKAMEKQGVKFHLSTAVQRVDNNIVTYKDLKKNTECTLEAETILVATGRKPCTEGLNLDAAGVEHGPKGIATNDNMQTNREHIYAIGDVNGRQMLAHAATFQGMRAVNHLLGRRDSIRLDIMPAAVFTHPEVAAVGPTEEACKAMGLDVAVRKAIYRANGRAQASEQTEGLVKLLVDGADRIVACHALGADAAYLVQEIAALMNLGATRAQLADMVHIHPTLSEILLQAAGA